jgi:hypothetical protein
MTVKKSARGMQEASVVPPEPQDEQRVRVTLRTSIGFEYHQVYPQSVVIDLLDPDVPDGFIEIQLTDGKLKQSVKHRFLHTSNIAEVDIHDALELNQ